MTSKAGLSGGASDTNDIVDVTRDNFERMLPIVEKALQDCSFFAMDCEMTGLFLDGNKEEYLDEMCDRYARLRDSSHAYMVNQFGLSCFKQVASGAGWGYEASTFNFYLFPEPREGSQTRKFLSDPGALSFLASQGFDFNTWIHKGIPFMCAKERQKQLQDAQAYYSPDMRTPVVPSRQEDIDFVAGLVEQVRQWLATSADRTLTLPEMNSYRRLLSFQELRKPQFGRDGYPGFFVNKVATSNGYAYLELTRGSAEEVLAMQEADVKQRIEAINTAAGFTRVLEAIRRCNRPAVGHNCSFDVAYVLAACAEPVLPPTWPEYKQLVAEWFRGGVYDTKHMARQLPDVFEDWTGLGDVYKAVTQDGDKRERAVALMSSLSSRLGEPSLSRLPFVRHAPGFEKYQQVEAGALAHEAGYDAFMTGVAFACVAPLLHSQDLAAAAGAAGSEGAAGAADRAGASGRAAAAATPSGEADAMDVDTADEEAVPQLRYDPLAGVARYKGRLNVARTDMPYVALFGPDPPLERPNVFFASGLPSTARQAVDEVTRAFQNAGLGKPRVTLVWGESVGALVEVDAAVAPRVLSALSASGASSGNGSSGAALKVVPWAQYSAERAEAAQQQQRARSEGGARPGKRTRRAEAVAAGAGAAAGAEGAGEEAAAAGGRPGWCVVM